MPSLPRLRRSEEICAWDARHLVEVYRVGRSGAGRINPPGGDRGCGSNRAEWALSQRPQPASLLQASCALGLAFSHCVIERVSLFDILLFMQVQYLSTTGADWPSSLLSDTQAVIHFVSSALWRWASAGAVAAAAAGAVRRGSSCR